MISLPEDILITILSLLRTQDLLVVKQVCKFLYHVGSNNIVWSSILQSEIIDQKIPIPGLSRETPETSSVEHRVRRALLLHQKWTSPNPQCTKRFGFSFQAFAGIEGQVTGMKFLPRDGGRWLIILALATNSLNTRRGRTFYLQCWDLDATPNARCIAHREIHNFGGWRINTDPDSQIVLAIKNPHINGLGINFASTNPENGFFTLLSIQESVRGISCLSGFRILAQGQDGNHLLYDLETLDAPLRLIPQSLTNQTPENSEPEPVLDALIDADLELIILVRSSQLEYYSLSSAAHEGGNVTYPLATHSWQWKIDSVVMSRQASTFTPEAMDIEPSFDNLQPQIHILARYGSLFPWPINAFHHFTLDPSPSYDPSQPTTLLNCPYSTYPVLRQTISSPIRLFALSHTALGNYGTAVWFDSHTEDYFGHADHGQRLVGMSLKAPSLATLSSNGSNNSRGGGGDDGSDDSSDDSESDGEGGGFTSEIPVDEMETEHEHVDPFLAPGSGISLYTRAGTAGHGAGAGGTSAGDAATVLGGSAQIAGATTLFDVTERDRWMKVAVWEEEGRIAVAAEGGTIEVRDYA